MERTVNTKFYEYRQNNSGGSFSIKNNEKFKTITNSEGKQELVGIYKY